MIEEVLQSPFIPLLTFLIGMLVGHWLTIHRDKRKEYNELVGPLRKVIAAEASSPSVGRAAISRHDMDAVAARMNCFVKFKFVKACEAYWEAKKSKQQDELGQPFHDNEDRIRKAAQHLLDKTPYR